MPTLPPTSFDPDLHFPIGEKTYTVKAPGIEETRRIRTLISDTGLPAVEQIYEALHILGDDVIEQMIADDVPHHTALHAGRTALLHFGFTPDVARIHWSLAQLGSMVDLTKLDATLNGSKVA